MAKQVMQFRYYGEGSDKNYPKKKSSNPYHTQLQSGSIFTYPITQLTIHASENVEFYLNGNDNSIMTGSDGYYRLDLEGIAEITNLKFNTTPFKDKSDDNFYLIIDAICGI